MNANNTLRSARQAARFARIVANNARRLPLTEIARIAKSVAGTEWRASFRYELKVRSSY